MTLEDLVPPLDLCKRIPAGEFEESALVWLLPWSECKGREIFNQPEVCARDYDDVPMFIDNGGEHFSAPTLPEIMAELPPETECSMSDMGVWYIINPKIESIGEKANNPATAALRLWLKLKGVVNE